MTSYEPRVRHIHRILVANRGEIAARIIRTATRMGIETLGIVTQSEPHSLATETLKIEEYHSTAIFLNQQALIKIAIEHHADAIHPGYGFLSENGEFARAVEKAGLIFIGPSSPAIILMGNKNTARKIAMELNIPVVKATSGSIASIMEQQHQLPYPLLVKADAGGGGKAMLTVYQHHELEEKLVQASREALNYFGNGSVFVEQLIKDPRHIEVQILGDRQGNLIHLFERECSIQRRYQKIIEEAPSPFVDKSLRQKLTLDALKIGRAIDYYNAGTIEFLIDKNKNHYFLEMNTRIQVEHPVTEMVTGVDIVEQQLRIAMGMPLVHSQKDLQLNGHAIECRLYAEDTENNFIPHPGKIHKVQWPSNELARTDTWFNHPVEITTDYDPMMAKIVTHAPTRSEAIAKADLALHSTHLTGLVSNIHFLRSILKEPDFINGHINTGYCRHHVLSPVQLPPVEVLASAYLAWLLNYKPFEKNVWQYIGFWRMNNETTAMIAGQKINIKWTRPTLNKSITLNINNNHALEMDHIVVSHNTIKLTADGKDYSFYWGLIPGGSLVFEYNHKPVWVTSWFLIENKEITYSKENGSGSNNQSLIQAPIPGKITDILVAKGAFVKSGDRLMTLETMKMENHLNSTEDGIIETIFPSRGQQVKAREVLLIIRPVLAGENQ